MSKLAQQCITESVSSAISFFHFDKSFELKFHFLHILTKSKDYINPKKILFYKIYSPLMFDRASLCKDDMY